jgi:hypothetical protein
MGQDLYLKRTPFALKNSHQFRHLTTSEVPKTRSRSHAWKSCLMWVQKLAGMASPNSTTSGRITPTIGPRHHDKEVRQQ